MRCKRSTSPAPTYVGNQGPAAAPRRKPHRCTAHAAGGVGARRVSVSGHCLISREPATTSLQPEVILLKHWRGQKPTVRHSRQRLPIWWQACAPAGGAVAQLLAASTASWEGTGNALLKGTSRPQYNTTRQLLPWCTTAGEKQRHVPPYDTASASRWWQACLGYVAAKAPSCTTKP